MCRVLYENLTCSACHLPGDDHVTKSHIKMASTTSHIAEQCVSNNKGKFCLAGVQKQGGMKMKFENCKEYCSLKNNKENIRKLMKEFECEASGRSNLIRPLVTDENGRFDEEKRRN